ncbi:hypothetical protein [Candidatus Regiella insecticola]|nr:hypothetical protein [Candidatus Regiella insecticola]
MSDRCQRRRNLKGEGYRFFVNIMDVDNDNTRTVIHQPARY